MRRLTAFLILAGVKTFSHIFYRAKFTWSENAPANPWLSTKIIVLMNHTSLYEPIYSQAFSYSYLWHLAGHLNVPGADVTLKRPIVGFFWTLMVPNIAPVSRKKDDTWTNYLNTIKSDSIIMIAPEGRMKRPNGLDKSGKPMTVRGGLVDIVESVEHGAMVLCLSGGLHHVQSPGQHLPRLFKTIKMNLTYLDIPQYRKQFPEASRERKVAMVADLQQRLENDCPKL
jgi:hypothetical protein